MIAVAQKLLGFESITPAAAPIFDWLTEYLQSHNWQVERVIFDQHHPVPVENLFAWKGDIANKAKPHLCFAGHLDVVPAGDRAAWQHPPFAGTIDYDKLYGRGMVDMKGAIAAFIAAANTIDFPGTISLLLTGDEEGPALNGTAPMLEWLNARGQIPDFCIVGEPSCSEQIGDTIRIGRRGSYHFTITVHGQQGHVAYPERVRNPHPVLAYILEYWRQHPLDLAMEHFPISTWQITQIATLGETARNLAPSSCLADGNIRFNPAYTVQSLDDWLQAGIHAARKLFSDVNIEIVTELAAASFLTSSGHLTSRLTEAVQQVAGIIPRLDAGGGTSDARFIQAYCPVVEFGLCNATAHQIDENAPLKDLNQLHKIYQCLIELLK